MTKPTPFPPRFWKRVEKTATCWIWIGGRDEKGYGLCRPDNRRTVRAHRWTYEQHIGPIPAGMLVDHTCHNPSCVRPDHLRLATNKQNLENLTGAYANNVTGIRGVSRTKFNTFRARVRHNGVLHDCGSFKTKEEAGAAAQALRMALFTHNNADRVDALDGCSTRQRPPAA